MLLRNTGFQEITELPKYLITSWQATGDAVSMNKKRKEAMHLLRAAVHVRRHQIWVEARQRTSRNFKGAFNMTLRMATRKERNCWRISMTLRALTGVPLSSAQPQGQC